MTRQKNEDTDKPSGEKGALLAIFRTVYGTPLTRMIKFFTASGVVLLVGALATDVIEDFGHKFADLFGTGKWADFMGSAVILVINFLNNSSDTLGWVFIGIAIVLLGWFLYERQEKLDEDKKVPRVSIQDGQVFFFNRPLVDCGFFTRRRFWATSSLEDRLTAMNIPHSQDQRMKIAHYKKLDYSLDTDKKKQKPQKGAVKYLLKNILPNYSFVYLLGDSGMGKSTTFIKTYHDFIFNKHNRRYRCFLIHSREWETKQIEWQEKGFDPKVMVLFLDGMDEDTSIYDKKKLDERLNRIANMGYHRVLVSCRTQFFESSTLGNKQKLYLKGFSKTAAKQYLNERFPLWQRRFPWLQIKNKENRKQIRTFLAQNDAYARRPMIIDWLCQWVKEIDKNRLKDDFSYPYQLEEAIMQQWYGREQLTLQKYGFYISIEKIKTLMESLAVRFYLEENSKFRIPQHQLGKFFEDQGITSEKGSDFDSDFDRYCRQVQTHSLLKRDHLNYFSFAHRSIWELIMARLLFTNKHPKVGFDEKIKQHQGILDFYNDMCWNEIVPPDFGGLSATEKSALKLYEEKTFFHLLNKKNGLNLEQYDVNRHGSVPMLIASFSNPAVSAFFLGMNRKQLLDLPWKEGQFACFKAMLKAWHENMETSISIEEEETVKVHFAQETINCEYKNVLENSLKACRFPLTVADYISNPYCLFVEQADGKITYRHKCLLDYYIFCSDFEVHKRFLDNYARCCDFIILDLVIQEKVYIDDETLHFCKANQFPLLKFYPRKEKIKKLTVENIKLDDVKYIVSFKYIKELYLSQNGLEQASEISQLTNLRILYLHNEIKDLHFLIGTHESERPDDRKESGLHLRQLEQLSLKDSCIKIDEKTLLALACQPYLKVLDLTNTQPTRDFYDLKDTNNCLAQLRETIFKSMPMVEIEGGDFQMGYTRDFDFPDGHQYKEYIKSEKPDHLVTVPSFKLAKYAVTLGQFREFIDATAYKTTAEQKENSWIFDFNEGKNVTKRGVCWQHDNEGKLEKNEWKPVIHVSWYDAVHFCNWLSKKEGLDACYEIEEIKKEENITTEDTVNETQWRVELVKGKCGYRLPSEAEWEYAAKDGCLQSNYFFAGSDTCGEVAWTGENAGKKLIPAKKGGFSVRDFIDSRPHTHPVGQKISNYLGLYDMSGNVWEWCEDDWHGDYNNAPKNGRAWVDSPRAHKRVFRGGSWDYEAEHCRVSYRNGWTPGLRYNHMGFRVAHSSR